MRIGLIDVDGHNFPNVALMKIASWHRMNGDDVEWALPMFGEYDRIYASKVFTFTPDYNPMEYNAKEFIGGVLDTTSNQSCPKKSTAIQDWHTTCIRNTGFQSSFIQGGVSGIVRFVL